MAGGQDPVGRDQRAGAEEALAEVDLGDRRVRAGGGVVTTDDGVGRGGGQRQRRTSRREGDRESAVGLHEDCNATSDGNLRLRARLGAMAATASERDDVQPVANENLDRFLTGTVTVLPILALGVVAWQVWSSLARLERPDRVRDHVRRDRPRHHGRLPPAVHAPLVQDGQGRAGDPRRARQRRDRGPGHLLGRRPPQAPRLLRQAGRPALAPRRPRARPQGRAAAACCTRTSAGCSSTPSAA